MSWDLVQFVLAMVLATGLAAEGGWLVGRYERIILGGLCALCGVLIYLGEMAWVIYHLPKP